MYSNIYNPRTCSCFEVQDKSN